MEAQVERDRPWLMRTYAGYQSARESNELYRLNLSRGQTGLSVAFDLPTQTGYDPDHVRARGEVGRVGVSVAHLGDLDALFDGLPLEQMNTSMTINATAPWLLALYVALARRRGDDPAKLRGTVQNDLVKEYLSRGLYIFPPGPSMRLTVDTIAYAVHELPRFNPINVCSYHLQESGATPVQELSYALANAVGVLDAVRDSGQVPAAEFSAVVGRLSFFVNAGIRFVEEACKMRAFTALWDEITATRYGVEDPRLRRFRYGVQVNSLGLTELQPENNLVRIVLESLGVLLSKNARARAMQLPAWNEALGLPRAWDQQWSLRIQQILAHETDLLELDDILDGSPVIESKVRELTEAANEEIQRIEAIGGVVAATESGYLKRGLVASQTARLRAIERGERVVVGVNRYTETSDSPLTAGDGGGILHVDPAIEAQLARAVGQWRSRRGSIQVHAALQSLRLAAQGTANIMPASIQCAEAGVTTGEWAETLRGVFGLYRAPDGIDLVGLPTGAERRESEVRDRVGRLVTQSGRHLRFLVAKAGLEGHTTGAEQIALKARQVGMEVILGGVRRTAAELALMARDEDVDLVGLSVLSGSHLELTQELLGEMRLYRLGELPVVVGGIIPTADRRQLLGMGVSAVFTPADNDLNAIMAELIDVVRAARGLPPEPALPVG
jgi:ethylmalonyl-CoA mutase